jgi:hypothetical protein
MLDHPAHAARMAADAQVQIRHQFRPELLGQELMEVYELALAFASERDGRRGQGGRR